MIYRTNQGQVSYGESVGILLLESNIPFIPGDVGNASTYPFPVRFERMEGLTFDKLLTKDRALLEPMFEAGHKLVKEGVKAITGDCGFMMAFQKEIAEELNVPVFMSSLIQIPLMAMMLGKDEKIGIICSNEPYLNHDLLTVAGIEQYTEKIHVKGLENEKHFRDAVILESGTLDAEAIEKETVAAALELVQTYPEIKMLLLECSILPPYAHAVQQATRLPVFDFVTLIKYVHSGLVRTRYSGFM